MATANDNTGKFRSLAHARVDTALAYSALGYRPIPIVAGKKCAAIKWKRLQSEAPTETDVVDWFSAGDKNIAVLTGNGVVVVDVDDGNLVTEVLIRCGDTPMRCKTPGGGEHLYYAMRQGVQYGNAVRMNGRPIDLRCEGAYAVCPWSRHADGRSYEWIGDIVAADELPPLDLSWLRERRKRLVIPAFELGDAERAVRRARGYLASIEGAIAGNRGHDRTFRVACVLAIKFGLTLEQAWPLFLEWNGQCEPPWSEKELLHKLHDALKLCGGRFP